MAVIVSAPTERTFVTHVALPEAGTTCALQPGMVTPPAWKSTVPVRMPDAGAGARTLAVRVMFWPAPEGLADEVSTTPAAPTLTVCVRPAVVEPVKLASPL